MVTVIKVLLIIMIVVFMAIVINDRWTESDKIQRQHPSTQTTGVTP